MTSKKDIQKKIEHLRKEIARHDDLYFQNAEPEISDFEYDTLKHELNELEKKYPEFASAESPTVKVGDDRLAAFQAYKHLQSMLSIDNSYNKEELFEFEKRLQRILGSKKLTYVVEPKIDGMAISLSYEKGHFVRAVTRGNGVEGDDITQNIKTISTLPLKIKGANFPEVIEIRGEVYMTYAELERINKHREDEDLLPYANPRNLAAGTVKLLDPKEVAKRKLNLVMYGVGYSKPVFFKTQDELLKTLKNWGFPAQEKYWVAEGIEEVWDCIESLDKIRNNFDYGTDGAVVKLDSFALQEEAGKTSKSPRWAIAYKFAPDQAETILKDIRIQVGRTGILAPVADFEPVLLAGSTIAHATLHNADEIERKDIRIGDTVVIEKAGDVIPAVVRVVLEKRPKHSKPFKFPKICPACGTHAVRLEGEVAWKCPNVSCPPQVRRRILHFASRVAMEIENLGVAVVDQLVSKKLCESYADLYELKKTQLLELEKFADKAAQNLIDAIEASKKQPLWRLIHGLGIENIGAQSAKDLAQHFRSLQALMNASEEDITKIEGFGPVIAQSIHTFFKEHHNHKLVQRLIFQELNTKIEEASKSHQPLTGMSFVLTGTLPTLKREEAQELIENSGGHVSSSVSKKTSYVLLGDEPGSKFDKAKKLGVPILSEKEFLKLIK